MSFDAWVVGFGLSRVLIELRLITSPTAYSAWLVVILVDLYLLYRYFRARQGIESSGLAVEAPNDGPGIRWQKQSSAIRNDLSSLNRVTPLGGVHKETSDE